MITKPDEKKINELMDAIMLLDSSKEAGKFFRDLLTENEMIEFGNRWKAARMLWDKESYLDITKETGLSSTTVARVSKWLSGGKGGYELMLKRLDGHHKKSLLGKSSQ